MIHDVTFQGLSAMAATTLATVIAILWTKNNKAARNIAIVGILVMVVICVVTIVRLV